MGNKSSGSSNSRTTTATPADQQKLNNLTGMGFPSDVALQALVATDGNFDAALAQLLNPPPTQLRSQARDQAAAAAQQRASNWRQNTNAPTQRRNNATSSTNTGANRRVGANAGLTAEEALQRAIQESMKGGSSSSSSSSSTASSSSSTATPTSNPTPPTSSANTIDLTTTAFDKLAPKGLSKLAKVLAPHPVAMDTIIKIIRTILTHPNNPKYRKMKWENKRFAETVKGAPGATDFLKKIGFVNDTQAKALVLRTVDEGVLLVAMQMLERKRRSSDYKSAVGSIEFDAVVQALLGRTPDAAEVEKRNAYRLKLPVEPVPKVGTQTIVRVTLGEHIVERRFKTDNTLNGVVDYLGSLSSLLATKINSGEWVLINSTTFPVKNVELNIDRNKTFYALEMWPSAWLTVQPRE